MNSRVIVGAVALCASTARVAAAAPGGVVAEPEEIVAAELAKPVVPAADTAAPVLTAHEVWSAVGIELVKQHVLLAMLDLRVELVRDASRTWFLQLTNTRTSCHASRAVGNFDVLSDARVRTLAYEVTSLIASSRCGVLPTPEPALARPTPRLQPWVRWAGASYAATSAALLLAISQTVKQPNLSLSFTHAPSAFISTGFMLGIAGGGATLFVPDHDARPLLELTVASSTALQALAVAQVPERGVPAFGEYAVASGYALTSVLVGVDWALSSRQSMLSAPAWATERDVPQRAISPYVVYGPAVLGSLVSLSRAFAPGMGSDDRELTLGLGSYALLPAVAGLVLGIADSRRRIEPESSEPWIAGGPRGSFGLSVGGWL
jgi:hypothetical protein